MNGRLLCHADRDSMDKKRYLALGTWHLRKQAPSLKTQDLNLHPPESRAQSHLISLTHTPHFMNHPRPRASNPRPDRSYAAGVGNAAPGFVGDVRSRDTPDPIPNSEVKSRPPMILQRGKVGHCRLQRPDSGKPGSGLFSLRHQAYQSRFPPPKIPIPLKFSI